MALSPQGLLVAARPTLGRAKRRTLKAVDRLRISGTPVADAAPDTPSRRAHHAFVAGSVLLATGRHESAVTYLERSVELDDRFPRRWIRYGRSLRLSGRLDEAAVAYRQAFDRDPNEVESMLWISLLAMRDEIDITSTTDPDEAVERLIGELDVADPLFVFIHGCVLEARGDNERARERFTASLVAQPDHHTRQLHVARFEASEGRWSAAADAYRAALGGDLEDEVSAFGESDLREALESREAVMDWPVLAAVSRARLERDRDDKAARRGLGLALHGLRQWEDAAASLESALELDPTDVRLAESWASAAQHAEDHVAHVEARQRAVLIRPTGARFHRLALALQRADRGDEAITAFDHAVRLGGARHDWFDRFGVSQRRTDDWAAAALLYQKAVDRFPELGHFRYFLGFALEKVGELNRALDAYEQAVGMEPSRADWWFRLAYLHEQFGPTRTIVRPRTGMELASAGDLDRAAAAYQQAIELAPDNATYWRRLGGVREQSGQLDEAKAAYQRVVELEPDDALGWHLLGRTVSSVATQRGMYHSQEHDELERLWGRAVELGPHGGGSREQLVRASIKAARWPLSDTLAWYPQPPVGNGSLETKLRGYLSGSDIAAEAIEALDAPDEDLMFVPREWWFPLHWKLLTDNHFTAAYRAKELMAARIIVDGSGSMHDNLGRYLEFGRALTFLDRLDEAIEHLQPSLTSTMPLRTRRALERQAADVALLMGDRQPHLDLVGGPRELHIDVAEKAFDTLVRGKSIAIVGPGLSDEGNGAEIDDHDVVIRTKFTKEQLTEYSAMAGSRTDISYYALGSARFLRDEIVEALATGDLKMAVFRTATYTPDPAHLVTPGDVRYVPSEYTAGFRASQFAIQRIFYDILRYGPASIKIYNIDFFLSPDAYRPGYLAEYANRATEQGFIKVLGAFGHDFLADFKFTQAMRAHGWLDGDQRIRQILELSPGEYLTGLDRRP